MTSHQQRVWQELCLKAVMEPDPKKANRDLEKMMENREFRSDLYYRLNVFPIRILD